MRNFLLLLVLLLLVVGIGLLQRYWQQTRPSFRTVLLEIDTARVDLIEITDLARQSEFMLRRVDDRWIVVQDDLSTPGVGTAVDQLLSGLVKIESRYLAEAKDGRWDVYKLDENQGTQVRIYVDEQLHETFIVGNNHLNQQTGASVSYMRLAGQNEIYAIDGDLLNGTSLRRARFIDRRILTLAPENVVSWQMQQHDTIHSFSKRDDLWLYNDFLPVDNQAMAGFLSRVTHIQGQRIATDFDELRADSFLHHRLVIQQGPHGDSYQLDCYHDSTRTLPFVLHSTQYPDSWWLADSAQVFGRAYPVWRDWFSTAAVRPQ